MRVEWSGVEQGLTRIDLNDPIGIYGSELVYLPFARIRMLLKSYPAELDLFRSLMR